MLLGIKKSIFADLIGFSQAYVSMVLSGKRPSPSERFLDSICREYQVRKEWLISGEGDMLESGRRSMPGKETAFLKKYNALHPSEQKIIRKIVDAFYIKTDAERD